MATITDCFMTAICLIYALVSCSVVVREDKKLLTVLFPDGRDGRAFTLKVIVLYYFLITLI